MPVHVLQTKLHTPSVRADLVRRERLLRQLDEGLQPGRRLILLCAPAGYGKSTLISQWAHARRRFRETVWPGWGSTRPIMTRPGSFPT